MDDVAAVVAEACRRDPSLPAQHAERLALLAVDEPGGAPEIARLLLEREPELDASWANAVAVSVTGLRHG